MQAILRFIEVRGVNALRLAVVAAVGIYLFVISKYAQFIGHILSLNSTSSFMLHLIAISVIFLLLLPWLFGAKFLYSYFLTALFCITTFLSFSADEKIKLHLAVWSGYFTSPDRDLEIYPEKHSEGKLTEFAGYRFSLPNSAEQVTHTQGMTYFTIETMELRPKCFVGAEQSIVTIVEAIADQVPSENFIYKQCFSKPQASKYSSENLYLCGLAFHEGHSQRHRWFVQSSDAVKGLELDWVLKGVQSGEASEKVTIRQVAGTIESYEVKNQQESLFEKNCVVPADWF